MLSRVLRVQVTTGQVLSSALTRKGHSPGELARGAGTSSVSFFLADLVPTWCPGWHLSATEWVASVIRPNPHILPHMLPGAGVSLLLCLPPTNDARRGAQVFPACPGLCAHRTQKMPRKFFTGSGVGTGKVDVCFPETCKHTRFLLSIDIVSPVHQNIKPE